MLIYAVALASHCSLHRERQSQWVWQHLSVRARAQGFENNIIYNLTVATSCILHIYMLSLQDWHFPEHVLIPAGPCFSHRSAVRFGLLKPAEHMAQSKSLDLCELGCSPSAYNPILTWWRVRGVIYCKCFYPLSIICFVTSSSELRFQSSIVQELTFFLAH